MFEATETIGFQEHGDGGAAAFVPDDKAHRATEKLVSLTIP